MSKPTIWIVGGFLKEGSDYRILHDLIRKKVKKIICLGDYNEKLHEQLKKFSSIVIEANSMTDTVKIAHDLAKKEMLFCLVQHVRVMIYSKIMKIEGANLKQK